MFSEAFPVYKAPVKATEMAWFVSYFAVNGQKFFNGKNIPVAVNNPKLLHGQLLDCKIIEIWLNFNLSV
jgi:hypothetical protein